MKKIMLSLAVVCATLMVSCGNSAVDKINQLVIEAAAQTEAASSAQEVSEIAISLQKEMDRITAEEGDKLIIGKSVDEALTKYQAVAAAKLAEFGIELE